MTFIPKPTVHHPALQKNELGLTRRDYEGAITTLCAGCGHDSITAAIIQAFWELSIPPHRVAKLSGIGCSSKTPAYFLREAHEINFVVEQNRDGQLRNLLTLETGVPIEKLESVRYYGGFPMSAHHVISGVKARIEKAA